MAAGEDGAAEMVLRIKALFAQEIGREGEARRRVRIGEGEVLALQIRNRLVGAVGTNDDDRVIAFLAVVIDVAEQRLQLVAEDTPAERVDRGPEAGELELVGPQTRPA